LGVIKILPVVENLHTGDADETGLHKIFFAKTDI